MIAPCAETFVEDHTHAHVFVVGLTVAWAVVAVVLERKRIAHSAGAGLRPARASFKQQ